MVPVPDNAPAPAPPAPAEAANSTDPAPAPAPLPRGGRASGGGGVLVRRVESGGFELEVLPFSEKSYLPTVKGLVLLFLSFFSFL